MPGFTTALPSSHQRASWIDAAKGIGILLVVVGHTVRGLFHAQILPQTPAWIFLDRAIYAFHMPLFFFLSGLFAWPRLQTESRPEDQSLGEFARRQVLRLGYPYVLWASLQTLTQVALSRHTNHVVPLSTLWKIAFDPPMQFWFLYALLLQLLWIGVLRALGLGRLGVLGIAVALSVSAPHLSLGSWLPLLQARDYLIFTCLGVACGDPAWLRKLEPRRAPARWAITSSTCLACLLAWVASRPLTDRADAFAAACLGILGTLSLVMWLALNPLWMARRIYAVLVRWGTLSLAIFVAHTLASAGTRIVLQKLLHVEAPLVHLTLGIAAGIWAPVLLCELSQRRGVPYLFRWPSTQRAAARPSLA